jgi:hypothetical protein
MCQAPIPQYVGVAVIIRIEWLTLVFHYDTLGGAAYASHPVVLFEELELCDYLDGAH